jgi:hypothetical protein
VKKVEKRIEVTGSVDPWDGSHKNVETISGYFAELFLEIVQEIKLL